MVKIKVSMKIMKEFSSTKLAKLTFAWVMLLGSNIYAEGAADEVTDAYAQKGEDEEESDDNQEASGKFLLFGGLGAGTSGARTATPTGGTAKTTVQAPTSLHLNIGFMPMFDASSVSPNMQVAGLLQFGMLYFLNNNDKGLRYSPLGFDATVGVLAVYDVKDANMSVGLGPAFKISSISLEDNLGVSGRFDGTPTAAGVALTGIANLSDSVSVLALLQLMYQTDATYTQNISSGVVSSAGLTEETVQGIVSDYHKNLKRTAADLAKQSKRGLKAAQDFLTKQIVGSYGNTYLITTSDQERKKALSKPHAVDAKDQRSKKSGAKGAITEANARKAIIDLSVGEFLNQNRGMIMQGIENALSNEQPEIALQKFINELQVLIEASMPPGLCASPRSGKSGHTLTDGKFAMSLDLGVGLNLSSAVAVAA
jgi:hypothetical protein